MLEVGPAREHPAVPIVPEEFHDLIQAYLDEELCSVEAVFIAMRRAEAQHA